MHLFHFDKNIHKGVFYLISDIIKYFELSLKRVIYENNIEKSDNRKIN